MEEDIVDNNPTPSLDLSWIDEEEMLLQYQSFLQPSLLESIVVQCIFLDSSNHIVGTKRFTQELKMDADKGISVLSREVLSDILSKYSHGWEEGGNTKYLTEDILLYNVDVSTEQLQTMSDIDAIPLKSVWVGVGDGITIPSSLVIFHSIQTLYVFLREVRLPKLVKSILKPSYGGIKSSTKRVRIHPDTFKKFGGGGCKTRKRNLV